MNRHKVLQLKISLESVVRISLYYQLQTSALSERIYRSSLNFKRIFPTSSPTTFCEKQLILNDGILIVLKRLFYQKIQNFINFMLKQCLDTKCLKLNQNSCSVASFIKLHSTIPSPIIGKFSKAATLEKSIRYPLVLKTPIIAIIKSIFI